MSDTLRPFHLAIPVTDLDLAKKWYIKVFNCSLGRESSSWVDFNFFGHQLVVHLVVENEDQYNRNLVDGKLIPPRHFGIVLDMEGWEKLADNCKKLNLDFRIEPHTRFKNRVGQQSSFFIDDPFGNTLEFKAFQDDDQIFAVRSHQ